MSYVYRPYVKSWDVAGTLVSSLCVMHCVATPLLAASLPVLAATEEPAHTAFGIAILLLGFIAFVPGYHKHRRAHVIVLGVWGMLMIGIAAFLPEDALAEEVAGLPTEIVLTVLGGLILVTAHVRNAVFCRACPVCRNGRTQLGATGC